MTDLIKINSGHQGSFKSSFRISEDSPQLFSPMYSMTLRVKIMWNSRESPSLTRKNILLACEIR